MELSTPASGMQTVDAAFDSAARSITQAFNSGQPIQLGDAPNQGDSLELSTVVAGLSMSKLDFLANEKVILAEDNLTKNAISVVG